MPSEILDNGVTQTISATSFSANDKSSDSITSDSSDSEDSLNSSDNIKHNEIPSQVTSCVNDDSSKRLLISDDSSNQQDEISHQQEDPADDQPVTTDLTLTKTVELTENELDPEPEPIENILEPESEQKTFNVVRLEIPEPMEMMRNVEEINDVKEMSLNNFESTMDDISDAELESLEHELEDLVATVEQSVDKIQSEMAVKILEDSIETTAEVKDEQSAMIRMIQPETGEPEETSSVPAESSVAVDSAAVNDQSEIQEISVLSENVTEQRESPVSDAQEAVEPTITGEPPTQTEHDPVLSTSSTDESTSIQNLPSQSNEDFSINESNSTGSLTSAPDLGRVPPYWIPDNMTNQCMHCDTKFSMIKRRHHCRACGLLLCSNCCSEKFQLHYLGSEGRICKTCHETLVKTQQQQGTQPRNPNPANPMEYCSTLPPQQQVSPGTVQTPTVMVPSGVLKRGPRSSERKSVIFSDGIRPGTDLDEATGSSSPRAAVTEKPPKINMPQLNEKNNSFITEGLYNLPPILSQNDEYMFVDNNLTLLQRLRQEELKFAINKNFYVTVKVVTRESSF